MREVTIEEYLIDQVKARGGLCPKFSSPAENGWPDRLVLYKGGTWFVETKAPEGRVSPIQAVQHRFIRAQGHIVFVPYTKQQVDLVIQEIFNESADARHTRQELSGAGIPDNQTNVRSGSAETRRL